MDNCKECTSVIKNTYDTICKTYYRLEDLSVLCYRHWHQANRPWFGDTGEYSEVFSEASIDKTLKAILAKKKREKMNNEFLKIKKLTK